MKGRNDKFVVKKLLDLLDQHAEWHQRKAVEICKTQLINMYNDSRWNEWKQVIVHFTAFLIGYMIAASACFE